MHYCSEAKVLVDLLQRDCMKQDANQSFDERGANFIICKVLRVVLNPWGPQISARHLACDKL